MTPVTPPPSPAAVAAFLRGLDRRARLFAAVQAGDAARGERALAAVARVFAAEAGQWPLAQWPQHYWRLLLSAPSLRQPAALEAGSPLPGIARLPADRRAAVLLHLVAGLEDDAASSALGVSVPDYQALIRDSLPHNELGQPDPDVWRAWRAATQRELERPAELPPLPVRPAAEPAPRATASAQHRDDPVPSRGVRWLWLGVAACVLAFAAAFFIHPMGREAIAQWFSQIKREALPPAAAPKARFDAADPALHPDRDLLASPREAAYARELPLLAWLANASDPAAVNPVALPLVPQDANVPPAAQPDETEALARRARLWDRLPAAIRGERRGAWQAWRALTADERVALRAIDARFRLLPPERQQVLRADFEKLSFDARNGWRLGPQLGRDWPRVAALFGFLDADEREPVLRLLREAPPADIDALARLAQSTPPEERAALRHELLAQPAAQRGAWLQSRLQ